MAILNYSDLGLIKSNEIKTFKWNDKEIEVFQYLPIDSRYDIVMITLQESYENGIYNPIKLDKFFHLNLVYMYTNLIFTDDERMDTDKLFDEMKSTGFFESFLKNINAKEYAEMQEDIEQIARLSMQYKSTAASVLRNLIEDLPANAEAAQKIIDNFDPEKYQNVMNFAKAANGGRPIG